MSVGRGAAVVLCACLGATLALAEADAQRAPAAADPQLVALTLRFESVGDSELWGSDLDWVRRSPKEVLTLGVSTNTIGGSEWTYLKGGVAGPLADDLFGQVGVELGVGDLDGRSFDYRKVRSRLTRIELAGRLELFGEAQAYDIDRFDAVLLEAGASYRFSRPLAIRLSYLESVAGNWDSRIAAARLDMDRELDYFVGGATGVSTPDLTNLSAGLEPETDYAELYAGLAVPIRESHRLMLYLSWAEQGKIQRRGLVVSWQRPMPDFGGRASR